MSLGKIGYECKVLRNTATWDTPTWSEIDIVTDNVDVPLEKTSGEIKSRGATYVKERMALIGSNPSFVMNAKTGDANFEAIRDAYFNNTSLDIWFADGPAATSGTQGLRAWFKVKTFSRAEPLEGAVLYNITLALDDQEDDAEEPEWRETA